MKVKSTLYEVISGSIGTITGAMGLGGAYFKEKTSPNNPQSANQLIIRDAMKNANTAWGLVAVSVKEAWNEYAKTMSYINSTGHTVKQTGWTAFNASYVLMTQGGMNVAPLSLAAPTTAGYLTSPSIEVELNVDHYEVVNKSVITMQISAFISPKEKNTINTNTKGYSFVGNASLATDAGIALDPTVEDGRYFVRARRIEIDGGMSNETVITSDLAAI